MKKPHSAPAETQQNTPQTEETDQIGRSCGPTVQKAKQAYLGAVQALQRAALLYSASTLTDAVPPPSEGSATAMKKAQFHLYEKATEFTHAHTAFCRAKLEELN